jgi:hypothetical protein
MVIFVSWLAFVLLLAIVTVIYLIVESYSLKRGAVKMNFYCPFRKKMVEIKARRSLFTYRKYDDVLECSAFDDAKVRCEMKCLNLPEVEQCDYGCTTGICNIESSPQH